MLAYKLKKSVAEIRELSVSEVLGWGEFFRIKHEAEKAQIKSDLSSQKPNGTGYFKPRSKANRAISVPRKTLPNR